MNIIYGFSETSLLEYYKKYLNDLIKPYTDKEIRVLSVSVDNSKAGTTLNILISYSPNFQDYLSIEIDKITNEIISVSREGHLVIERDKITNETISISKD